MCIICNILVNLIFLNCTGCTSLTVIPNTLINLTQLYIALVTRVLQQTIHDTLVYLKQS